MPAVTIVIPAYNPSRFLIEAIHSAVKQSGETPEIIVVDDGSRRRGSARLFEEARSMGARVLRTKNRGVAAARNTGISEARDGYILPLDADDRLVENSVTISRAVLDARPEVGIVAGAQRLIGAGSGENPCAFEGVDSMLKATTIPNISMFRKSDWEAVGGYPEELKLGEDWAFWMRMLRLGVEVAVLPEVLHEYRVSAEQVTARFDPVNVARAQNLVLAENLELYGGDPGALGEQLAEARLLLAHYRANYRRLELLKTKLSRLVRR